MYVEVMVGGDEDEGRALGYAYLHYLNDLCYYYI